MKTYTCTSCLKPKARHWFVRRRGQRATICRLCGSPEKYVLDKKAEPTMRARYVVLRAKSSLKGGDLLSFAQYCGLLQGNTCAYCKRPVIKPTSSASTYGLDRIDNARGYSLDNVVPCCGRCNFTRGNRFTHDEFMKLGAVLANLG